MLFNSIEFLVFLPIVYCLFWLFKNQIKVQTALLVVASYIFYGWWDWRFLILIAFSSLVDYLLGIQISRSELLKRRKFLLIISLVLNLGLLGTFKYFNFFTESFVNAFTFFGGEINPVSLQIILPMGISFYTFQTLSYTIDVFRNKMKPTKDLMSFLAFVSFFPQLVAGPIERASNLLPQFSVKKLFNYSKTIDGLRQMLWGFLKKVVIADNAAIYVNDIFNNYTEYSGSTLFIGVVFFLIQVYGDFSGYSDIAIGTAKLFWFKLNQNFKLPIFSSTIPEFWLRWHISLGTWFKDYVFIPLGGSKLGNNRTLINLFLVFVISGFWHGANWTFIFWGAFCGAFMLLAKVMPRAEIEDSHTHLIPSLKEFFQMMLVFLIITFSMVYFRSENIIVAHQYFKNMLSISFFGLPDILPIDYIILLIVFMIIEWLNRDKEHVLCFHSESKSTFVRILKYSYLSLILWVIILWGVFDDVQFIYFQF